MLSDVKLALRRTDTTFDTEIQLYIDDCLAEMEALGIYRPFEHGTSDKQIKTAVIAYCKWKAGNNDDAERWEHIYRDKIEKLQCMTGYGLPED